MNTEAPHQESEQNSYQVSTAGGAYIAGDANTSGDLVGRDKITNTTIIINTPGEMANVINQLQLHLKLSQPKIKRKSYEPETVFIPAGPFLMGSHLGPDIPEHEIPQHEVTLLDYRIGRFSVTNAEYEEFVRQSGCVVPPELGWIGQRPPEGQEHYPVSGVTWYEALAYCAWLSQATDRDYCLPNEAQWEKAARGVDGRIYPWGNTWEEGRCNLGAATTTSVNHFPVQSIYGCSDLVGNGREWTTSLWGERLAAPDRRYRYPWRDDGRIDPKTNDQMRRIWRASAYNDLQRQCRCAARGAQLPTSRGGPLTRFRFRVAMRIIHIPEKS